jgi:hypothetical protein
MRKMTPRRTVTTRRGNSTVKVFRDTAVLFSQYHDHEESIAGAAHPIRRENREFDPPGSARAPMAMFDVVVIGGGVIGSAAAAAAAAAVPAARVCLLEASPFLHRLGSSHGESRITRYSYPSRLYTGMMVTAYREWAAAEAASGYTVFTRTGGLDLFPPGSKVGAAGDRAWHAFTLNRHTPVLGCRASAPPPRLHCECRWRSS